MEAEKIAAELVLDEEKVRLHTSLDLAQRASFWDEARHCNADWELHLILSGACLVDMEEKGLRLCADQALLIAPGQYHRPKAAPGEFLRFSLSFSLSQGSLLSTLKEKVPQYLILPIGDEMCRLAKRFFSEGTLSLPFYQNYRKSLLEQIGIEFFRKLNLKKSRQEKNKHPNKKSTNDLIDQFFELHFREKAGEEKLAELLHVSRRQLVRILQKNYGMNFRQKILCARMDYAAWLLRATDEKIGQISGAVGYSSEATFFTAFQKHFGMTPKRYRTQKKDS